MIKNLCLTAKSVSLCLLKNNCLCNWIRALPISWPMYMLFCKRKSEGWMSQNIDIESRCVCFERKRTREASRTILITALFIVLYKWSRCNMLIAKSLPLNSSDSEQTYNLASLFTHPLFSASKGKLDTRISKDWLGKTAMELCFSLWLDILFNYPSLSLKSIFVLISCNNETFWWMVDKTLTPSPRTYSHGLPISTTLKWTAPLTFSD